MLGYTREHTWVLLEDGRARVGISDFAQRELGDITYVELPPKGRRVERGDVACTVDSLKSSSEIYAPVSGMVVDVNDALAVEEQCGLVNSDPLGAGWLFALEVSDARELELLLPEQEYLAYVEGG